MPCMRRGTNFWRAVMTRPFHGVYSKPPRAMRANAAGKECTIASSSVTTPHSAMMAASVVDKRGFHAKLENRTVPPRDQAAKAVHSKPKAREPP